MFFIDFRGHIFKEFGVHPSFLYSVLSVYVTSCFKIGFSGTHPPCKSTVDQGIPTLNSNPLLCFRLSHLHNGTPGYVHFGMHLNQLHSFLRLRICIGLHPQAPVAPHLPVVPFLYVPAQSLSPT